MANIPTDLGSVAAYPTDKGGQWTLGLTKRELFAAMAMQGYCSCTANQDWTQKEIAADAVAQADALLTALEQDRG